MTATHNPSFAGATASAPEEKIKIVKWKATGAGAETVVSEDASVLTGANLHVDQRARGGCGFCLFVCLFLRLFGMSLNFSIFPPSFSFFVCWFLYHRPYPIAFRTICTKRRPGSFAGKWPIYVCGEGMVDILGCRGSSQKRCVCNWDCGEGAEAEYDTWAIFGVEGQCQCQCQCHIDGHKLNKCCVTSRYYETTLFIFVSPYCRCHTPFQIYFQIETLIIDIYIFVSN